MPKYMIADDFISEEIQAKYDEEMAQGRALFNASNLISEAMYRKNISQNEMAKCIGVSKGYASRLLSGTENISLKNLARILHILGEDLVISTSFKAETAKVVWPDFGASRENIKFNEEVTRKPDTQWTTGQAV
jgi:transcriptional regulator with XRE-family HTH domain